MQLLIFCKSFALCLTQKYFSGEKSSRESVHLLTLSGLLMVNLYWGIPRAPKLKSRQSNGGISCPCALLLSLPALEIPGLELLQVL